MSPPSSPASDQDVLRLLEDPASGLQRLAGLLMLPGGGHLAGAGDLFGVLIEKALHLRAGIEGERVVGVRQAQREFHCDTSCWLSWRRSRRRRLFRICWARSIFPA